jgi:hypothetical protein
LLAVLGCDANDDSQPDSGRWTSIPDGSTRDGGRQDASMPDASQPDAGVDATVPDGSLPVTTLPDGAFTLRLDDDAVVVVEAHTEVQIMQWSCSGWDPAIDKRVGATWQPLQDDRHPHHENPGYFLDGEYVEPSFNEGCDALGCFSTFGRGEIRAGYAREYVKTGTRALSSEEEDAGVEVDDPADVVETRAFHGELRVRFKYSLLEDCDAPQELALELEVP